jgi:hypothetical protein
LGQTLAKSGFVNANVVKIISEPNWLLLTSSTLRVASPKRLARPPFVAASQGHGFVPILRPLCRLTTQQPKSTNICSNCNQQLPREYLEEAVRGSPDCLGTFGLKGHGKTAFLSALTLSAEQLHKISPKAFSKPLDDNTRRKTSEWHIMEREGNARMEATPPNTRPTPLLSIVSGSGHSLPPLFAS